MWILCCFYKYHYTFCSGSLCIKKYTVIPFNIVIVQVPNIMLYGMYNCIQIHLILVVTNYRPFHAAAYSAKRAPSIDKQENFCVPFLLMPHPVEPIQGCTRD